MLHFRPGSDTFLTNQMFFVRAFFPDFSSRALFVREIWSRGNLKRHNLMEKTGELHALAGGAVVVVTFLLSRLVLITIPNQLSSKCRCCGLPASLLNTVIPLAFVQSFCGTNDDEKMGALARALIH